MICPNCECDAVYVYEVRHTSNNETYRDRRCKICGHKFYTIEFEIEEDATFAGEWRRCSRHNLRRKK